MCTDSSQMTVARLVESNSHAHPNATALVGTDGEFWSFEQLWTQVRRLASHLQICGVEHDQRVAIVLPNGPHMALTFLGVACVATGAPLNPNYREAEYALHLTDLRARALIVADGQGIQARRAAESLNIPVWEVGGIVDSECAIRGAHVDLPAQPRWSGPEDEALVLHTSGTTSRPKQVPLTQHNLLTSARNICSTLQLTATDRLLNVMPLFHIHGLVAGLLAPLSAGGSIVCTPGFAVPDFLDWLARFSPTWYTAVPTMHQAILAALSTHPHSTDHHQLRLIRSSSASLPPRVMADLEERFGVPVIEAYGMTEASHQMTSNPLPPGRRKPGSVGIPAGPDVAIMDEKIAELLIPGHTGEIVIRGTNVTKGYANNPDANAKAFANGWFRTGDQGYFDEGGYLFITGRLKEMINRGGENIAPREVDEVLMTHPAVTQAVTFAVPHATLGEDVATAVTLRASADVSAHELRRFAFDRLADFKVPTEILLVNEIPKGPTGKLQRIGLADALAKQRTHAFVAPRDPVEEALAGIWAEVLDVAQVGSADNFFSLGGDSISATRIVARVRKTFDIELPLPVIFREPVLDDQALYLTESILAEIEDLTEEEAKQQTDAA